tara:strand:+ start:3676 stop:3795 length:120 start_codon:yes stop_codon:yes gene_type:complete
MLESIKMLTLDKIQFASREKVKIQSQQANLTISIDIMVG